MVSPELDGGLNMFSKGKLMKRGIVQQTMFDDTAGYRHRYHGCVLLLLFIIIIMIIIINYYHHDYYYYHHHLLLLFFMIPLVPRSTLSLFVPVQYLESACPVASVPGAAGL